MRNTITLTREAVEIIGERMTPAALGVYVALMFHEFDRGMGQAAIGRTVGVDRRTIRRALPELEAAGLVACERSGTGRALTYRILRVPERD